MYHPVSLAAKTYIPGRYPWYQVHTYIHPKKTKKKGKKERNGEDKKRKGRKVTRNKKLALRAQAESRGDKVAVCCYDQSYDMSS